MLKSELVRGLINRNVVERRMRNDWHERQGDGFDEAREIYKTALFISFNKSACSRCMKL